MLIPRCVLGLAPGIGFRWLARSLTDGLTPSAVTVLAYSWTNPIEVITPDEWLTAISPSVVE